MTREIKSYASLQIDNRSVIILGDSYEGSPLIAYNPDILIVPKSVYKKYSKECFLFLHNNKIPPKTKIIKI